MGRGLLPGHGASQRRMESRILGGMQMESQQQGHECIYVYSCTGMHRLARVFSCRALRLGGPWIVRAGVVKMDDFQASLPHVHSAGRGSQSPLDGVFSKTMYCDATVAYKKL